MTRRTWFAASGAIALTATMAACANLPTSGTIQVDKLHGTAGVGQNGVQVVPRPPGRDWLPLDIVGGFLTASASYDPNHKVAKEYLTSGKHGFGIRWRPGWQATIIDKPKENVPTAPGRITEPGGGPPGQLVVVSGKRVATLVTAGRYQAGSVVVDPPSTKFSFDLVRVAGQWRINDILEGNKSAPTSLLLLRRQDFERVYQSRNLYFYRASGDSTITLVPDPVYIPAQVGKQGIRGLVQTLLRPALDNSWLFGAAQTAFPSGTKLLSAQVVGGITAVVNLGGAAAKASPSQQQRMAAQLFWSLAHPLPYPAEEPNPISSVVLKINGRQVKSQPYNGWVPRGPGGPVYYQVPGGPLGYGVAMVHSKPSQAGPVALPKTLAGQPFTAMAVSAEPLGSAVLAGCLGKTVYLMPQSHSGQVIPASLQAPCMSLSWDELGNLWVATKMQVYEIPGVGGEPSARPPVTLVLDPQLGKASIQSLRVAPDGVRVAMIIRSGAISKIRIAAISKSRGQGTYIAQTSSVLRVGTDIADPIGLSWLDPDHLLVLGRTGSGRTQLYEVPLNGGQSTPIATPSGVTSVTASWPGKQRQPFIAVAIAPTATSPAEIQTSISGWPSPDWQQVAKGPTGLQDPAYIFTPVFPG
jgi:hypothetical protein